ncbi:hypothetical protein QQX13_00210 [Demequina sp. SYSU T00068]|uniref:hypothetical protein n=1 Tax=Demequina lignilytica TaxID=3051663 RepID=UPI00262CE0ED|nr:hypothetical protein [Demequina sp. SYSU T00068]MDN4489246.1 hypothetical protein [Demequina sp. SYSU T00068]
MLRGIKYALAAIFATVAIANLVHGPGSPSLFGAWGIALNIAWVLDVTLQSAAAVGWFLWARRGHLRPRSDDEQDPRPRTSRARKPLWVPVVTTATATAVILGLSGWALVDTGLNNAYSFEVVDQQARSATTHTAYAGNYRLIGTGDYLCGDDEDFYGCLSQHVAMYNTVCVGMALDSTAQDRCEQLSDFIDDLNETYSTCGYGCRTRTDDQRWGWDRQKLVANTVSASSDNAVAEITHLEHCYFELGSLTIGNCPAGARTR